MGQLWVRRRAGRRTRVWLLGLAGLHALLIVVLVLKVCASSPVSQDLRHPGAARARRDTGNVATALVLGGKQKQFISHDFCRVEVRDVCSVTPLSVITDQIKMFDLQASMSVSCMLLHVLLCSGCVL